MMPARRNLLAMNGVLCCAAAVSERANCRHMPSRRASTRWPISEKPGNLARNWPAIEQTSVTMSPMLARRQ
jgi:hypothetical protein